MSDKRMTGFVAAVLCALLAVPALAAPKKGEANVVLHSTITGNQEQPKVLYIVPWQQPGSADRMAQPLQPMLNDVFAPIDRREFQRELKYRSQIEEQPAPEAAP